jgi:hypothetical protein
VPGLIAFGLTDDEHARESELSPHHGGDDGHDGFTLVFVLLNAAPGTETLVVSELAGRRLRLHPVQASSADPIVRNARFHRSSGTFTVPGRTAAVFVASERD